jgi:2'-5' RNA ligase
VARLFVAVYPPTVVVDALAALPRAAEPNVRWVPVEQLHVTLRFFGEADVESTKDRLAATMPAFEPVTATMGPRISRLGRDVVCVPVAGLDGLASAVAEATADLGAPPDPRPFRGHITLARLRRRAACGLTGAPFAATFVTDRVHLVESVTRREGAQHSTIASFVLAGPPTADSG